MADLGVDRVPLLDLLAPDPARRHGTGQPGRRRVLRPARRRAARPRHRPGRHAVPLGPAAGAGGRRRLAAAGTPRTGSATTPAWSAQALGDRVKLWITLNEPFVHLTLGYGARHPRAGPHAALRRAPGRAPPAAGPRPRGRRAARTGPPARSRSPTTTPRPGRPATPPTTAAARRRTTPCRTTCSPIRCWGWATRPAPSPALSSATATSTSIAAPIDALGVNYYFPTVRPGARGAAARCRSSWCRSRATRSPRSAGRSCPTGCASCWSASRRYGDALPPIYITENGCAYDDTLDADGRCDDPERVAYLDGHIRAAPRRDGRRRRRARATSSGRCWTTSSGRRVTPSGSGWSTSTSPPRCARPKTSYRVVRGASSGATV